MTHDQPEQKSRLPLWVAAALSLATVGPTLAMSGNGQGVAAGVGKGIPLVFLIGLIGISLIGYGFVRLTRHLNHAGSVYALVGVTIGPRSGFFAGFAMLGAYLGFSIGIAALVSNYTNVFLTFLYSGSDHPPQVSWSAVLLVELILAGALAGRDTKLIGRILMAIEGLGIVFMLVLVAVIFGKGGAENTGIDWSVFTFSGGVGFAQVVPAIVAAFLSWAGFEACASLGEETDNPRRNIPRALAGTLMLTGVMFVVVMFAQTIGFGTDAEGIAAFASSGNTLGDLGVRYIGTTFGLILIFTAIISAFACLLASVTSAGRLLFAFARDGFGPQRLARLDGPGGTPRTAMWLVLAVVAVTNMAVWATGWPTLGTGIPSLDAYILFATAGAVALMLAYLLAEVAAIAFVTRARFRALDRAGSLLLGVLLPALGIAFIAVVLWYNIKDQSNPWNLPANFGIIWATVGLIISVVARKAAERMRVSLAEELGLEPELPIDPQGRSPEQSPDGGIPQRTGS